MLNNWAHYAHDGLFIKHVEIKRLDELRIYGSLSNAHTHTHTHKHTVTERMLVICIHIYIYIYIYQLIMICYALGQIWGIAICNWRKEREREERWWWWWWENIIVSWFEKKEFELNNC